MTGPGPRVVMFLHRPLHVDSRVEREARTLVSAGYRVEVIALAEGDLPESEERDGYSITRLDPDTPATRAWRCLSRSRTPGWLRRLAFRAYSLLRWRAWARRAHRLASERGRADLYIGHDLDGLVPAVRARRGSRAPLIYDAHELYPDMAARDRPRRELRAWIRYESRLVRHPDLVFAVTSSRAAVMADRYGIETPTVLRNVPETSTAGEDGAPRRLRRELGLGAGTSLLLYLGNMQATRGLEQAVEALPQLPDAVLVIVGFGDAEYVRGLRGHAERMGVGERVVIEPAVPPHRVVAVASQADVGLVVNHRVGLNNYLTLPNKIFEYVAAGTPVVASDFPDMAELVRRYDVGAVCDPEEPADIARAVRTVIGDPARHRELRRNAERAAPELCWEGESEVFLRAVRGLTASAESAGDRERGRG